MKRPKCPLCLQSITEEEASDFDIMKWAEEKLTPLAIEDREFLMKLLEKFPIPKVKVTQIWMHNPKNIHEDIQVMAHIDCFDKVKPVHAKLGEPTQDDWKDPRYPVIRPSGIILMMPDEFMAAQVT